ncbi:TPA: hypothetical protein DEO28_02080 [Candidatus Dependentiae bacterium]|nr:MAG: hypothetical protein UR14_C0004G0098 [candidate division TM6 bacterium GW2011_GWE2_31_21]KKP53018.1 MAG: hypothetical protein UR43_C0008G0100 [candidate division TM6 bacterium GW2011_GWF2_33_332]HBS47745.1 hypothetical protein [Candidatus Dependentiae bacterium]HBZ73279.1 hypothetical protein [Candidatus Dependentiae bacterium]
MIKAENLCLNFGQQIIFDHISFNFSSEDKIGLVGRNGSGKSTLLKILSKKQIIDEGKITTASRTKIAYLPQEVVLVSNKSILDETLNSFEELFTLKEELDELENRIENLKEDEKGHAIERMAFIQSELFNNDFDRLVVDAKKILIGLGFKQEDFTKSVEHLSGGFKMRVVLAKLLLQNADFYLFDEPTNHLDIVTKDWFLYFLKNAKFGFLLVCHDKYFLDNICDYIYELDRGKGRIFQGNYSQFLQQKEGEKAALEVAFEQQQRDIKKKMETINRFRAKASKASMAQSMLRSLEKVERIQIGTEQGKIKLNFQDFVKPGKVVLKAENLSKKYNDHYIFKNVSFELLRDEKAAIVAANGVGKTTLLNLISQKLKSDSGSFEFGHNVKFVTFEQDQEKVLDKKNTVLEECEKATKTSQQRAKIRSMLGAFLFSGDDVYKKIAVLSGGEKNRVAMVKVLLQDANFLILDEPTNHLDLESKDNLLQALQQYPGTVLFVSHDRNFLDNLATKILELTPDGLFGYSGNYEDYLYQKEHQSKDKVIKESNLQVKGFSKKEDHKKDFSETKDLKSKQHKLLNLEKKIASLEKEKAETVQLFEKFPYGTREFDSVTAKLQEIEKQLLQQLEMWQKLFEELNN